MQLETEREMKYYAVIDTNVLVSAMLKWDSVPGCVVEHSLVGDIIPLLDEQVLAEYTEVLNRPKFHFDNERVKIILDGLMKRGIFINAEKFPVELRDPKDIIFYEIVMEKRKTDAAFLITGNIKHFPVKPFIVTPREMLTILETKIKG